MRGLRIGTRVITVVVLVAAVAAVAAAGADAKKKKRKKPIFKTDHQVEVYVGTQLPTWAGLDLRQDDSLSVSCINGAYSRYEDSHPKVHYKEKTTKDGEYAFRTFACTLTVADGRTFNLYVRAYPKNVWKVIADR